MWSRGHSAPSRPRHNSTAQSYVDGHTSKDHQQAHCSRATRTCRASAFTVVHTDGTRTAALQLCGVLYTSAGFLRCSPGTELVYFLALRNDAHVAITPNCGKDFRCSYPSAPVPTRNTSYKLCELVRCFPSLVVSQQFSNSFLRAFSTAANLVASFESSDRACLGPVIWLFSAN